MADMNDIVRVAVDAYNGNVTKYSVGDSMQLLHEALVQANGGSTTMDVRAVRDGKCQGVFALLEQIIPRTVVGGLQGDEYFNALVEFRNVEAGDKNVFEVEDFDLFYISEAAEGTQGIRRQRLGGSTQFSLNTSYKVVKIYEELNRVLAGRVDFNHFISKVSESFRRKLLDDIYTLWANATTADFGGATYFPTAGTYDEAELLELIEHVEAAANGKPATIIGTKTALRNLAPSIQGDQSKSDLYNMGYYGKFYGSNVVALPQRHKLNSTEFIFDPNMIHIIAGDDKPIKCVYEGQALILPGDPMQKADFTQEYLYGEKYGLGLVMANGNSGIGRYKIGA